MKSFCIREQAYDKIMHWVDKAEGEVSGLGIVNIVDGVAIVEDAMLLEQENTGSSTDIDPVAICKALTKFMKSGKDGDIKFWWHSHVNMDVFWSGTDHATIKELSEHGWFLHTVFNKRKETKSAFSQNIELFGGSSFFALQDDIEMEILENENEELTNKDKLANQAYATMIKADDRVTTLNDKKAEEIERIVAKYKERIEKAENLALEAKDEYEQLKGEANEERVEEWDAEFDEKVTEKSYYYSSQRSFPNSRYWEDEDDDEFDEDEAFIKKYMHDDEEEDENDPFYVNEGYPLGGHASKSWHNKVNGKSSDDELVRAGFKRTIRNGVKCYEQV